MAVAATGFFDGVHIGHIRVIETLVSEARRRGEESLILTLWPHPRAVLQKGARSLRLLSSLEEKRSLISACGVDRVEVLPFTKEFATESALSYLRIIRDRFALSEVVLGYDNRIGSDSLLPEASSALVTALGMESVICPPVEAPEEEGGCVSSTLIRKALSEGRIENANAMLGRPYRLSGVIVAGNRLGRTIGFPTANLNLREPLKLLPCNGVYLTRATVFGKQFYGMTNIGIRPTVSNGDTITIETNIFDFNEDIYGLDFDLEFLAPVRKERRFGSLEELRAQLESDRRECLTLQASCLEKNFH